MEMQIRDAQIALTDRDFDPGPIDGMSGPKTARAILAFQASSGLPRTGILDKTTYSALSALSAVSVKTAGGIIRQGARGHVVDEIIMHCSATRPNWMSGRTFAERFAEIRRWHMQDRGWRDIGYHWVIDRDGSILSGRIETEIGAHVVERNAGTIGICLLGGHGSSERDRFSNNFTPAQDAAARRLIADISARTTIRRVSGHNQYAKKACPGFDVTEWLEAA